MRDLPSLYQSDEFPVCLERFLPRCLAFVNRQRANFVNPSQEQLHKFAKHLILCFYMEHGDVERVGSDIESLLNENQVNDKERDT
jgi:hypothetical protein